MTDEEVQRAMEEGTPVVVPGNNGRQVVGVVRWRLWSHAEAWSVQLGEIDSSVFLSGEIRLATAEELLIDIE